MESTSLFLLKIQLIREVIVDFRQEGSALWKPVFLAAEKAIPVQMAEVNIIDREKEINVDDITSPAKAKELAQRSISMEDSGTCKTCGSCACACWPMQNVQAGQWGGAGIFVWSWKPGSIQGS